MADENPEFTVSPVELITACLLTPSEPGCTLIEGGRGSAGSVPKVTVWLIDGSRFVHTPPGPDPHEDGPPQEAHQRCGLRSRSGRCHDCTDTDRYGIGLHRITIAASLPALQPGGNRKQHRLFPLRLTIVKVPGRRWEGPQTD